MLARTVRATAARIATRLTLPRLAAAASGLLGAARLLLATRLLTSTRPARAAGAIWAIARAVLRPRPLLRARLISGLPLLTILRLVTTGVATLAALQRVVSSAHYPSDVACGAALGLAAAAACLSVSPRARLQPTSGMD